jgi:ketol-acid reductoisomerase
LRYQQNLQDHKIAIVVLMSTSWPKIQKNIATVVESINAVNAGDYLEVAIPDKEKTE